MFLLDNNNIRFSHMQKVITDKRRGREHTQHEFDKLAANVRKTIDSMAKAGEAYIQTIDDKNTSYGRLKTLEQSRVDQMNEHIDSIESKLDDMGLG